LSHILSLKFNIKELSLPVVKDVIVNNFFGVFNTLSFINTYNSTLTDYGYSCFSAFIAPALKGEKLKNQHVPFRDSGQKHVDF